MEKTNHIAYFDPELKKRLILRRYLDLPKFVDFLRTSELYLKQASRFEDRLEGTLPEELCQAVRDFPEFVAKHGDASAWEQKIKDRTYLSCWTLGSKDNMALWKLYGGAAESIAITTTIGRLETIAPSWEKYGKVNVKKVRYIDHAERLPNGVYGLDENIFSLKHVAYSYEKEVRIVVTRPIPREQETVASAIRIPVDLEQFLRSIVIAPEAEDWFFNMVVDLAAKYNVVAPVRQSELTRLIARTRRAH